MGETRIGKSLTVQGEIEGGDDVLLFGRAEGGVITSGRVVVDKRAVVHGPLQGRAVDVSGSVEGAIRATERIEIRAEANVSGDLRAPRILIADGARFEGNVHMDRSSARSDEAGEEDQT